MNDDKRQKNPRKTPKGVVTNMRILIIRNYPTTLNLEKQSYNIQEVGLAKALVKKGHCCDVVFWTNGLDESKQVIVDKDKSFTVFYIHAKKILKNGVFPKQLDDLADTYDIIQLSEYNQYQPYKYAKKFSKKMVVLHGPYYAKFNKRYNLLCRIFDLFFLNRYRKLGTQFMVKSSLAEEFLLNKGIKKGLISRVYVGIDETALWPHKTDKLPQFVEKVCKDQSNVLLYVGRLEPRRKSLFLLDVFNNVRLTNPDTKLVVVGDGEEAYKAKFRQKIEELGIGNKVEWEERIEQKYLSHLYKKSKVFLLPTEFEIFGMVLLEAMFFSSVVVTTYNGGSRTLIKNGENGIYIKGFDKEEWTDNILKILEDQDKLKTMGTFAHKTIADGFMWDTISDNYIKCYQKKLGDANSG